MVFEKTKKGQGGLEYIILFSFTVVFFVIVVYVANEQLSIVNKQQRLEQAKLALKEIADAATQAYQQGAGARVVTNVVFPNGVSGDGEIVNNSLHIIFEGSDLSYPLGFPITGKISTTPGSQEVVFTSYGNSVSVGTAEFSLSKYSVLFQLCTSQSPLSANDTIQITNNKDTSIDIDGSVSFISPYANLTLSQYSFNIPAGQSQNVSVNLDVAPNTISLITGNILFNTSNFSIIVPITVDVESCGLISNVSYIILETYKDSNYSIPATSFNEPPLIQITTNGWLPFSNITLDLRNASGSVPGYPKIVQVDGSGSYSEQWNATGMPDSYTVYANYSSTIVNYSFTVNPC